MHDHACGALDQRLDNHRRNPLMLRGEDLARPDPNNATAPIPVATPGGNRYMSGAGTRIISNSSGSNMA